MVAVITKLSSNSLVNGAILDEKYIFIIFGWWWRIMHAVCDCVSSNNKIYRGNTAIRYMLLVSGLTNPIFYLLANWVVGMNGINEYKIWVTTAVVLYYRCCCRRHFKVEWEGVKARTFWLNKSILYNKVIPYILPI